ncbi:hypothetical protein FRC08_009148 [Ceratobasidium sp. 394]|nr:hypothetical protein FRC08_009148 [Ceratobasidium sp. 394]
MGPTNYDVPLVQGAEPDRKFLSKSIKWETCIFNEGHVLKSFQSQRYQQLVKIQGRWRSLLTGTPLQNNLQGLVSLISFILPGKFTAETIGPLRTISKVRADSHTSLLSQEHVSRVKAMMTPFVLRRRKDQVLKDLPNKTEHIIWCTMAALQCSIYNETMSRSRKELEREAADSPLINLRDQLCRGGGAVPSLRSFGCSSCVTGQRQ